MLQADPPLEEKRPRPGRGRYTTLLEHMSGFPQKA